MRWVAAEQVQSVWFLCLVCGDAFAKYVYLYGSALLGLLEQKERNRRARGAHTARRKLSVSSWDARHDGGGRAAAQEARR